MFNQKNVSETLTQALEQLGLSKNAILAYTTSLSLGPVPIADLAARLSIQRTNVYKLIVELEEKGLAEFSSRKHRMKTFVVAPPTRVRELLSAQKERVADLDRSIASQLPDLLALYHQGERSTGIRVLSGKDQWMKVFWESLDETSGEILFCGNFDEWVTFVSWEEEASWIARRVSKKIPIKLLFLPGTEGEQIRNNTKQAMREIRILKAKLPFVCSFQIFANKLIIWQPKAPVALLVEDEHIVAMLMSLFLTLWEGSEIRI